MSSTAKGEFKKALHVYRLTADKVQLGTAGGYGWQNFTPTLTGGTYPSTMVVNSARYRIVDTTLECKLDWSFTANAGGASSSVYTFALPTGCTASTPVGGSGLQTACGDFALNSVNSGVIYTGTVQVTGTSFTVFLATTGVATIQWGNSSPADTRWTVAGGFSVGCRFACELNPTSPILGEAPIQISNGTGSVLPTTQPGGQSGSLITGQFA